MEAGLRGYCVESCARVELRSDEAEHTLFRLDKKSSLGHGGRLHAESWRSDAMSRPLSTRHEPLSTGKALATLPSTKSSNDVPNTETENDGKAVGRQSRHRPQIARAGPERAGPQKAPPNESLKTKGQQKKDVRNEGTSQ
jgi:hypothetical protein